MSPTQKVKFSSTKWLKSAELITRCRKVAESLPASLCR